MITEILFLPDKAFERRRLCAVGAMVASFDGAIERQGVAVLVIKFARRIRFYTLTNGSISIF